MFLRTVATFFDVITFLACIVGAWQIYTAFMTPNADAIQVGAGIVLGVSIAAVPYFIAGAFHRGVVRELLLRSSQERAD